MVPLVVLGTAFLVFGTLGRLGVPHLRERTVPLRWALAVMFLVTASAHFGPGREDLIRMVPPVFPRPDLLVTLTGVLEIAGAAGLVVPRFARRAGVSLALLLVAMFPANVYASLAGLELMGAPVTPLPIRTVMQVVFIVALVVAADLRAQARAEEAR